MIVLEFKQPSNTTYGIDGGKSESKMQADQSFNTLKNDNSPDPDGWFLRVSNTSLQVCWTGANLQDLSDETVDAWSNSVVSNLTSINEEYDRRTEIKE